MTGYQFPELRDAHCDADWLWVRCTLRTLASTFERTEPALLTWEATHVANWLLRLATHADVFGAWPPGELRSTIRFIEPLLTLRAFSGHPLGPPLTLRVSLGAEFSPPGLDLPTPPRAFGRTFEVELDFAVDASAPRALAEDLRRSLARFPVRVARPSPQP